MSALTVTASLSLAQPIPTYKSYEDYCFQNPQAPTCIDGKPITIDDAVKNAKKLNLDGYLYKPKKEDTPPALVTPAPPTRRQTTRMTVSSPAMRPGNQQTIQLGSVDWRFAHPHSDLLIGVDVENLMASELMRALLRNWAGKLGATPDELEKLPDALSRTKRMAISIFNNDVIAMLVGNTDTLPTTTMLANLRFTQVGVDTLLLGSEPGSFAAMTRLTLPARLSDQVEEARLMAGTYDFWILGSGRALAALSRDSSQPTPVRKLKLGATFRDDFRLQMILETADAASAARLFRESQTGKPRDLQGVVEGNSVRYAMALNRYAAMERFGGFITDSIGKQFTPLVAAAREISKQRTATAIRPSGKIIIDGLDSGPKEVPIGKKE